MKADILTAWDALTALETKRKAAAAPVHEMIRAIMAAAQDSADQRETAMTEKMTLRDAETDEASKAAIQDLTERPEKWERPEGDQRFKGRPESRDQKSAASTDPDASTSATP